MSLPTQRPHQLARDTRSLELEGGAVGCFNRHSCRLWLCGGAVFVPGTELSSTTTERRGHDPHAPSRIPDSADGFGSVLLIEGNRQHSVPRPVFTAVLWQVHVLKRQGRQRTRIPRDTYTKRRSCKETFFYFLQLATSAQTNEITTNL